MRDSMARRTGCVGRRSDEFVSISGWLRAVNRTRRSGCACNGLRAAYFVPEARANCRSSAQRDVSSPEQRAGTWQGALAAPVGHARPCAPLHGAGPPIRATCGRRSELERRAVTRELEVAAPDFAAGVARAHRAFPVDRAGARARIELLVVEQR